MHPILNELEVRIAEVTGTFVRVCFALPGYRESLGEQLRTQNLPESTTISHGSFNPNSSAVIHSAAAKQQIESMTVGGTDETVVANMCLCFIYALWEDHYREAFSNQKGLQKNAIQSDLFGEIANYRNAIMHNDAKGTSKTETHTVLPPITRGDRIAIHRETYEEIVRGISKELQDISLRY